MKKIIILFFTIICCSYSVNAQNSAKTYGKFTINGKTHQVTNDLINQFSNWLSSQPRDVQYRLADIRRKLQNGHDVEFDAHSQSLSGNVDMPLNNARQARRMNRQRTGIGMFLDALTGNNIHKNAVAMDALRGFNYIEPSTRVNTR